MMTALGMRQAMGVGYFDFSKTIKTSFGCFLVTTLGRDGQEGWTTRLMKK